ncbi:acyltransferase family protein [Streptomyces luteireticuli]|uniref:acyltransferase family protein n=1 Tax=Streptomyces luteireticuli TaxID=173858 RepID=UPI003557323D
MKVTPVRGSAGPGDGGTGCPAAGARLDSLTGLRWFATLGVFLSHVNVLLPVPHTRGLFSLGESGVSLFFVLSGFVLTWTWTPDDTLRSFYGRRFARVWPLLVVAVAVPTLFALTSAGSVSRAHMLLVALSAVLLVQAWVPGWILTGATPVTWSLSCEAFFYALFPFAVRRIGGWRARQLLWLAGGALALLVALRAGLWLARPPETGVTSLAGYDGVVFGVYSPAARVPQFLIGMVTAVAVRAGWRAVGVRTASALLLVPLFVLWMLRGSAFRSAVLFDAVDTVMTPFFALLIAALAGRDLAGEVSLLRSRALTRLGQWSYAFYLFQFTVLLPVARAASPGKETADFFTDPVRPAVGHVGYAVLGLVITLGVSAFFYRWVEHPWEKRIRRRFTTIGRHSASPVAPARGET